MTIERIGYELTVCKVGSVNDLSLSEEFYFIGRTDEEISLVCVTSAVPAGTTEREDGWKGFRVKGTLDFSLTGILSELAGILADSGIGIFAVSTYNTDYILVKAENYENALGALEAAGHTVI